LAKEKQTTVVKVLFLKFFFDLFLTTPPFCVKIYAIKAMTKTMSLALRSRETAVGASRAQQETSITFEPEI
jgi:hypothetical protein